MKPSDLESNEIDLTVQNNLFSNIYVSKSFCRLTILKVVIARFSAQTKKKMNVPQMPIGISVAYAPSSTNPLDQPKFNIFGDVNQNNQKVQNFSCFRFDFSGAKPKKISPSKLYPV